MDVLPELCYHRVFDYPTVAYWAAGNDRSDMIIILKSYELYAFSEDITEHSEQPLETALRLGKLESAHQLVYYNATY